MAIAGGIDLGGSKIEAALFGPGWARLRARRWPTPGDYPGLIAALAGAVSWLREAGGPGLPVGLGMPGPIVPGQQRFVAVQLPLSGAALARDLAEAVGTSVPIANDANCFALSEALAGAGRGRRTVYGLILGTGVGGGVVQEGRILHGRAGYAGELGHVGMPAELVAALGLPVLACGCGRAGCYETLLSGPGLTRLAGHCLGHALGPEAMARDGAAAEPVLDIWARIAVRFLELVQLAYDPDCIVLGGGVTRLPGLLDRLRAALPDPPHYGQAPPVLHMAEGGDSSGTRGAAMLALAGSSAC